MKLDDAPVIGRIGPRPDGLDTPFWEALKNEQLVMQRCGSCRTWIWGPQWICPTCHALEPGWEPVETKGTIYSWTRTWQPFVPEFKDTLPYVTLVVELANRKRLVGLLVDSEDETSDPVIGAPVVGVVQHRSDCSVLRWRAAR